METTKKFTSKWISHS